MERSAWIDDELALLGDQVARFLAREFVSAAERWSQQGFVDRSAWWKAGENGLLCASIPAAYGGGDGHWGHEAVIAQEVARAGLNGGFGIGNMVSSGIVAHYILAYGSEAQKQRWLPAMARGELIGAVAMSEPSAGSDLKAIKTAACKAGGHYLVNGAKTFVSNGQQADLVIVAAKTDPAAGRKGFSLLVLETRNAAGFQRGRALEKIGLHAQDTSELFFDDVRIPAENLLGPEEGCGFAQLTEQLAWERLSIALICVAEMERAVEITAAYAQDRSLFGGKLFDLQNTQFKLAECKTLAAVARSFVDGAMVAQLGGTLAPDRAAMAKWWASDSLGKVVDDCLQLHGGYGYMIEYPIARMWADARIARIYGGSNETMKSIIAKAMQTPGGNGGGSRA